MTSRTADAFLLKASANGDMGNAEIALRNGANANCTDKFGRRPILAASQRCDHAMVALLMKQGADPRCLGSDGMYPMALAAVLDRIDVIDALGAHCWDTESPSDLVPSAFEHALQAGRDLAAKHLARHGAQLHGPGPNGETLLMRSSVAGQLQAVRLLSEEGAPWFFTDEAGFTALDYARQLGQKALLAVLLHQARDEPLVDPNHWLPAGMRKRARITRADLKQRVVTELSAAQNIGIDGPDCEIEGGEKAWLSDPAEPAAPAKPSPLMSLVKHLARVQQVFSALVRSGTHPLVLAASWLDWKVANAWEQLLWLKPERWEKLQSTRRFIAALQRGNLHRAALLLKAQALVVNARDTKGTPLTVMVVRALNGHDTSSPAEQALFHDQSRPAIALSLLRLLALTGARPHSFEVTTGANVGHAFMEGLDCDIYFKLLDEQLYVNTLNRSNARLDRPLHIATRKRDIRGINGLLARGCDRNPVNQDGHTPLHHCALNMDSEIASLLIASGANAGLRTRRGQALETMIKGMGHRVDAFNALIQARKGIEQVMSIFSPNNPMASVVRSQQKWGNASPTPPSKDKPAPQAPSE